jgi:hypothetical protein
MPNKFNGDIRLRCNVNLFKNPESKPRNSLKPKYVIRKAAAGNRISLTDSNIFFFSVKFKASINEIARADVSRLSVASTIVNNIADIKRIDF